MHGFAALLEAGRSFEPSLLDAIDVDLHHRGPDSAGRHSETGAALVFRRLKILDPENRSDQPFAENSGRCRLVFNGEIYGSRALCD